MARIVSRSEFASRRAILYYQLVRLAEPKATAKYQTIFRTIKEAIASGRYKAGQRLPSESELGKTFGASRITVNRALRELQLGGIIDRRVGSGSYVRRPRATTPSDC